MFGDNIKVHFAGSDGQPIFYVALAAAETSYRLYSCYKFIVDAKIEDMKPLPDDHVLKLQVMNNKHVIQDSGLFTLMFGAKKGEKQTRESLTLWQDKLIHFVQKNKLNATCVEIDCQKVLGVEDAWFFRERMRRLLPNRQINVFHLEDGRKGLDRLIEFTDYIAISVPEFRIARPRTFRVDVKKLAFYIKNRKPEIDIHLLGCTDLKMLHDNRFCTSADSTTWLQGVKYGYARDQYRVKHHIRNFSDSLFKERYEACTYIAKESGVLFFFGKNQGLHDQCKPLRHLM